jgi:MFS family permease
MLIGRGIGGLGAGLLQGTIQVILADLIPARRRGVWLGVLAIWTYIVSSTLVVVANLLVADMGWRW